MANEYNVYTTPSFNRIAKALTTLHPEFTRVYERAADIIKRDARNRNGDREIIKFEFIANGEGQYRLKIGRFRFRYDVYDKFVILKWCGLSRENNHH